RIFPQLGRNLVGFGENNLRAKINPHAPDQVAEVVKRAIWVRAAVGEDDERHAAADKFVGGGVLEMPAIRQIPVVAFDNVKAGGEFIGEIGLHGKAMVGAEAVAGRKVVLPPVSEADVEQTTEQTGTECGAAAAADIAKAGGEGGAGDANPVAEGKRFNGVGFCGKLAIDEGGDTSKVGREDRMVPAVGNPRRTDTQVQPFGSGGFHGGLNTFGAVNGAVDEVQWATVGVRV